MSDVESFQLGPARCFRHAEAMESRRNELRLLEEARESHDRQRRSRGQEKFPSVAPPTLSTPKTGESRPLNVTFVALWLFVIVAGVVSMCFSLDGRIRLGLIAAGLIGYFCGK
jgi:hypothetical protein